MQGINHVSSTPLILTMPSTCNNNEVNSKLQDDALYHVLMTRIDIYNQYVALGDAPKICKSTMCDYQMEFFKSIIMGKFIEI